MSSLSEQQAKELSKRSLHDYNFCRNRRDVLMTQAMDLEELYHDTNDPQALEKANKLMDEALLWKQRLNLHFMIVDVCNEIIHEYEQQASRQQALNTLNSRIAKTKRKKSVISKDRLKKEQEFFETSQMNIKLLSLEAEILFLKVDNLYKNNP
jgi:hypothetical protein